jgi:tetratricopeptide (TPR) repeat protein
MTIQEIQIIYGQTVESLDKRALKNAFDALHKLASDVPARLFQDELGKLQETYRLLLHYYAEGSTDPMQAKIYNELIALAYGLTDRIRLHLLTRSSSAVFYSVRRAFEVSPESGDIAQLVRHIIAACEITRLKAAEDAITQLFRRIWTSGYLAEREMTVLQAAIETGKEELSVVNCQIISSLILALQEVFDKRKLLLLLIAAESDDRQVKLRAYTGLLLTLYLHGRRVACLPEIGHRIEALAEKPDFRKIVQLIILRFISSRETEKISAKIREEIIPEMMKYASSGEILPDFFESGMNPEWTGESGNKAENPIETFNRWQEEGADVMHSTFVHFKKFPFFNEISNWFLPFTVDYSTAADDRTIMKPLEVIAGVGFMCNSDLYSLYFGLKHMPEADRLMMIDRLGSQLNEIQQQHIADLRTRDDFVEQIIGQYVQDLYRFYKLFAHRREFNDIFAQRLDFHNMPALKMYFHDKNDLLVIADKCLHKNYFDDALTIYERLAAESSDTKDESLYQKTGYCRQMNADYKGALSDYAQAEWINPESKWLLRRIAQCYRTLKRPEKAVAYYLRCEKLDPDNLAVLLSIGSCYLEMKRYREALKYYFKVDYLDVDGNKAWRPVAWCSFLTGKYDVARRYYHKILSQKPNEQDYMNAGHTEWVLHDVKGALELYKLSVAQLKGDVEKFRTAFHRDLPALTAAGIDASEIPLILDKLSYSIE